LQEIVSQKEKKAFQAGKICRYSEFPPVENAQVFSLSWK